MDDLIVHSSDPVALIGGADIGPDELNILQSRAPLYVGVDRGADRLLLAGLRPAAVIGDLDSLSDVAKEKFADVLYEVAEQESVDFEKALIRVHAPTIYAVGFWGGRIDHSLAVLNVMARFASRRILLIGPSDVSMIVSEAEVGLVLDIGTRMSIMPIGQSRITTNGLRWDVTDYDMGPTGKTSASNEAAAENIRIKVTGQVLVSVPLSSLTRLEQAVVHG